MKAPLISRKGDRRWDLVAKILGIFEERSSKKIISKHGIKPVDVAVRMLKITLLSMCFSTEISHVISELRDKPALRAFTGITDIPDAQDVYRFLSRFTADQFVEMVLKLLNSLCGQRNGEKATIIVDTTDLRLDLNWFRKNYKKAALVDKYYKWAYSNSKGYYIGMKLVLAVEHPSLKPLAFLVFPGGPSDSKIFDEIVAELIRRRILRKADTVVCDKGFYAYKHYTDGIVKYGITPLIFPRKNFKLKKVLKSIQLTLDFFYDKTYRIKKKIADLRDTLRDFEQKIAEWEEFKPTRSLIEDIIKVMKKTFSLDKIHRFTLASVTKHASLGVLLGGIVISLGFRDKAQLQRLAEW